MIEDKNNIFEEDDELKDWDNTLNDGLEDEDFSDFSEDVSLTMDYISDLFKEASKYHLESEVVYDALKAMKENNNLTIAEAIKVSFDEWIK